MLAPYSREQTTESYNEGHRVVLLVAAPVGTSFRIMSRALGYRRSPYPAADLNRCENSSLPDIESRLTFVTHYALCVTEGATWDNQQLPLLDKFWSGYFWEHSGEKTWTIASGMLGSGSGGRLGLRNLGSGWSLKQIRMITSGKVIGRTDKSNEEISEIYAGLMGGWDYSPLDWNCQDLAIRLAFLTFNPSDTVTVVLKNLMNKLFRDYEKESEGNGGWGDFARGVTLAGVLVAAEAMGLWKDHDDWRRLVASVRVVEQRFPQLRTLHRGFPWSENNQRPYTYDQI